MDVADPVTFEQAERIFALLEQVDIPKIEEPPALCIAIFAGGLCKWLVCRRDAARTIENLEKLLKEPS